MCQLLVAEFVPKTAAEVLHGVASALLGRRRPVGRLMRAHFVVEPKPRWYANEKKERLLNNTDARQTRRKYMVLTNT